jgi:hypothetical protein
MTFEEYCKKEYDLTEAFILKWLPEEGRAEAMDELRAIRNANFEVGKAYTDPSVK